MGRCVTSEGRLPPEAISDLHVVVPAQAAAVQVHGREVQNDLGERGRGAEEEGYTVPHTSPSSPARMQALRCFHEAVRCG